MMERPSPILKVKRVNNNMLDGFKIICQLVLIKKICSMKNKLSITCLILMIAPFVFSCGGPAKEQNKNNASVSSLSLHVGDEKYAMIDTKESVVTWKGGNLMGSNNQTGFVYLSKGELMIENGQLTGGTVEVDMNTIEDKNHGSDNKLVQHLKDPDFFEVKKFPFSTIAITRVASINAEDKKVTGNLTIKGITHPVTFPVKMEVRDGIVSANGRLVIDRTLWDVRYKSGKFYANLADQAMSDSIEFHMKIVAKK
jgi:polyisoprenoid-binding protein YceI